MQPLGLTPGQAADVAWAVARMGYQPGQPVLGALAAATLGPRWREACAEAVAAAESGARAGKGSGEREGLDGWSGALGQGEGEEEEEGGEEAAGGGVREQPVLGEMPPEQLARLAWAFASYNYFPPDTWLQVGSSYGITQAHCEHMVASVCWTAVLGSNLKLCKGWLSR